MGYKSKHQLAKEQAKNKHKFRDEKKAKEKEWKELSCIIKLETEIASINSSIKMWSGLLSSKFSGNIQIERRLELLKIQLNEKRKLLDEELNKIKEGEQNVNSMLKL